MLLDASDSAGVIIWSMVLIVAIVLLFGVVAFIKRRMQQPDQAGGIGFSLSDLRKMREEGHLTDEEFERAKLRMVARAKAAGPDAPSRRPPAGDA